jgi:outer membrane protein assembly factor BamA
MRAACALLVLAVLTLPAPRVAAQTARTRKKPTVPAADDDSVYPLPILKLTLEGNQQLPAEAILQATGIKVGDIATKELFEKARLKLVDTGYFDRVGYEFGAAAGKTRGYNAKFTVSEAKPLYKVTFAGFPAKQEELRAYLHSKDPLFSGVGPSTQAVIDRWAKLLNEWMAAKNPASKKIVGKMVLTGTSDYILQFQPDEVLPAVARVEFTGNETFDEITLQNSIGAVAYGLPYTEENFREFLDNQLKPLYEAKGMLRVRFEDITTEPVPLPVKGLLVKMKVVEGPVFKLAKVRFTGVKDEEKENLMSMTALKLGAVADFDQINEAAEKVRKYQRRSGYIHAKTSVDRKVDDAAKKVTVIIDIEHGERYEYGTLTIQGLDLNGEAAVRKEWGKQPGDPYNPDYPDYFLKQVADQGIFDHMGATHSTAKVDDQTHIADITLVFLPEEKKPAKDKNKLPGVPN